MKCVRVMMAALFAASLILAPAAAQPGAPAAAPTSAEIAAKAEADKKAAAEKAEKEKKQKEEQEKAEAARKALSRFQGQFQAQILAGDTINDFRIAQLANQLSGLEATIAWKPTGYEHLPKICDARDPSKDISIASKTPDRKNPENATTLGVWIAASPCLLPLTQYASIKITGRVGDATDQKLLFQGALPVSGFWFAFIVSILILALIYPGGAAASWFVSQRQYLKKVKAAKPGEKLATPPNFWVSLDPVELTKNPYGRASIAKLQIFVFSFIVFGLLLFHVLRSGLLAGMSPDILYLMGISAVGAAGGKMAYVARRRLSLENWAWLRRKNWLPENKDVAARANWSELFVDSNTKEFDPYRFQMAVFSLVVAIALIRTSATGLEAFTIPAEMLGLLGISQVVFIAGQAINKSGYDELDAKLTEVQTYEKHYQELAPKAQSAAEKARAAATAGTAPPQTPEENEAATELSKYRTAVAQAAQMFTAVYMEQGGMAIEPLKAKAQNPE